LDHETSSRRIGYLRKPEDQGESRCPLMKVPLCGGADWALS
jgi:hypothetical protein